MNETLDALWCLSNYKFQNVICTGFSACIILLFNFVWRCYFILIFWKYLKPNSTIFNIISTLKIYGITKQKRITLKAKTSEIITSYWEQNAITSRITSRKRKEETYYSWLRTALAIKLYHSFILKKWCLLLWII